MHIDHEAIVNYNEIEVGQSVLVVGNLHGRPTSAKFYEVTRKTKTRFTLTDENGKSRVFKSTISLLGRISEWGTGADNSYSDVREHMYFDNPSTRAWVAMMGRMKYAKGLREQIRLAAACLADNTPGSDYEGPEELLSLVEELIVVEADLLPDNDDSTAA